MFCECGCGRRTSLIQRSDVNRGLVKGEYRKFVRGHHNSRDWSVRSALIGQIQVDEGDRHLLEAHRWNISETSPSKTYATTSLKGQDGKWRTVYLHRLIMNAQPNQEVDHINGNGLDNRRENLRLATREENCRNVSTQLGASGYRGVCRTPSGRWMAKISVQGRTRYIGTFDSAIDAAKAYDSAARELHRVFARLNFPQPDEQPARNRQ